jgi:hypothetical protein
MTQVYFRGSNPRGFLVDRCGAVVDHFAEARDHAACIVRSLTMAQPRSLARLDLARQLPRSPERQEAAVPIKIIAMHCSIAFP